MFSESTAWFSSSTSHRKIQAWLDNGGREASFDDAEYIFSANAECEDTKRIFTSEAYLDEHLAVFHPNYISECLKQGGRKSEVLGKYFFPPKDVQKLIRDQMSLQWDDDGHTSDGDTTDAAKKQSQPIPGPSNISTKPPQTIQATTVTKNKSPLKDGSTTTVQQQEEQEYQRLEDLAKSTGELTDFVPGRDDCEMVIR